MAWMQPDAFGGHYKFYFYTASAYEGRLQPDGHRAAGWASYQCERDGQNVQWTAADEQPNGA